MSDQGDTSATVGARPRQHLLLSAIVRREHEHWIVHVLEHDFAAHGPTQEAALRALGRTIVAHLRLTKPEDRSDPLVDVPPAPMEFWDAWKHAPRREAPFRLTPTDPDYPQAYVVQAIVDAETAASAAEP